MRYVISKIKWIYFFSIIRPPLSYISWGWDVASSYDCFPFVVFKKKETFSDSYQIVYSRQCNSYVAGGRVWSYLDSSVLEPGVLTSQWVCRFAFQLGYLYPPWFWLLEIKSITVSWPSNISAAAAAIAGDDSPDIVCHYR